MRVKSLDIVGAFFIIYNNLRCSSGLAGRINCAGNYKESFKKSLKRGGGKRLFLTKIILYNLSTKQGEKMNQYREAMMIFNQQLRRPIKPACTCSYCDIAVAPKEARQSDYHALCYEKLQALKKAKKEALIIVSLVKDCNLGICGKKIKQTDRKSVV